MKHVDGSSLIDAGTDVNVTLSVLTTIFVAPVKLIIELPERAPCAHCGGVACVSLSARGPTIIWHDHTYRHDINCKTLAATKP